MSEKKVVKEEFPNISLAKDLENIIQGKKYQNPYSEIKVDE